MHCTAESQALDVCAVPTTLDELAGVSAPADAPQAQAGPSSLERRHATVPRGTPPAPRVRRPSCRRIEPPSQTDGTVSRSRANRELHASKLDRPHLSYSAARLSATSLDAAPRRPAGARGGVMTRGCETCSAGSLAKPGAWPGGRLTHLATDSHKRVRVAGPGAHDLVQAQSSPPQRGPQHL